jgi:hypothetical protein
MYFEGQRVKKKDKKRKTKKELRINKDELPLLFHIQIQNFVLAVFLAKYYHKANSISCFSN